MGAGGDQGRVGAGASGRSRWTVRLIWSIFSDSGSRVDLAEMTRTSDECDFS